MKSTLIGRLMVLAMALVFGSASAFAAQDAARAAVKRTVTIKFEATIEGKTVAPGNYEFEITGEAEPALVIRKNKQEVVRAKVDRQTLAVSMAHDQVRFRASDTGAQEIVGVSFRGGKDVFLVRSAQGLASAAKK